MNPKEQSNHYLMKIILLCFVDIPNHTGSFKFIVRVINVSLSGNYLVDAKTFNTVDIEGTIYNKTYTHMHGWDANACLQENIPVPLDKEAVIRQFIPLVKIDAICFKNAIEIFYRAELLDFLIKCA